MVDNKLKQNIMKQMSYTNRDYDKILSNLINLYQGDNPISDNWDNMSSSDPLFIILHLMAAHVDILNYQLDYQTLEAFMSTAKERASVVRNANSYGYKIKSYAASYALFTVDIGSNNIPDDYIMRPYETTMKDVRGFSWTYIGQPLNKDDILAATDGIPFYQGIPIRESFSGDNIDTESRTRIIGNQKIAIGNNRNNTGLSYLEVKETTPLKVLTEVPNLNTYVNVSTEQIGEVKEISNVDVTDIYELNVDPQGITYLRVSDRFDLERYSTNTDYLFRYLITEGAEVITAQGGLTGFLSTETRQAVSANLHYVKDSFVQGSNPEDVDTVRSNFKKYYAGLDSVITVEDFKRYIENQKEILGITKIFVIDKSSNTGKYSNSDYLIDIDDSVKAIYVAKGTEPITSDEATKLKDLFEVNKIGGSNIFINSSGDNKGLITQVPISFTINAGTLPETVKNGITKIITDYITNKEIAGKILTTEVYRLVLDSEYNAYLNQGINIQLFKGSGTTDNGEKEISLGYNELSVFGVIRYI